MKKVKVLYDYQILLNQKYGGVSRCFYELVIRLKHSKSIKPTVLGVFSQNYYFEKYFKRKAMKKPSDDILKYMILMNKYITKIYLKIHKVDILHATYYDDYLLEINNCKQVVTIHDMILEKLPHMYQQNLPEIRLKKMLMDKADKIIAVSENTKKDILNIYPEIESKKIEVIYNGGYQKISIPAEIEIALPEKYILYVGSRHGYKNYRIFMEAMSAVCHKYPEIRIVCVGGGKFSSGERQLLVKNRLWTKTLQLEATDEQLAYIYNHAIEFVFPSLYEGFGIPIVEAFANQCPVILSRASCFPEIAGDGALYFSPDDKEELQRQIEIFISEPGIRDQYIESGSRIGKKYTWDSNAHHMIRVYKELMKDK